MQTKKQSLIESVTNTAVGFVISLCATFFILPVLGIQSSPFKNFLLTVFFTVISILRGYIIRRYFNKKEPLTAVVINGMWLHCFECEVTTRVKEIDGEMHCSNCGLIHK